MKQLITSRQFTTWQIIRAYWQSDQRYLAFVLFAVIIGMTIVLVAFDVVFNYWYNYFYNALQAYDKKAAVRLLIIFFALAAFYIVFAVYRFYLSQMFGLRWRKWLTNQFINRWLKNRGYYYLEQFDKRVDNPDQRIQEDAGALVNFSLDLAIGIVGAVTTFFAFIYILWQLSGVLTIPIGSLGHLNIPGYLVWVSLIYALLGTLITFKIGHPLISLNFEQQRREASFRYVAMDLRTHAEHVALYRGEAHQKHILKNSFRRVLDNFYLIIMRQKMLLWFTAGYNQAAVILPLAVALPNYFDKVFLLGGLMQSLQAFGRVQDSLSYLVNSYNQIANWKAISNRLTSFLNHLDEIEHKAAAQNHLVTTRHDENSIITQDINIETPRNEKLLVKVDTTFEHGQNYLITGRSGIGKSTFIRALAGIWPYASGNIILPRDQQMMFVPQKPYMPLGSLADAILFPHKHDAHWQDEIKQALEETNLSNLIPRLNETAAWSEQLSPGEQQRIAFARILLHKPDWVFLDESTSMLDLANEASLYQLVKTKLPQCSIISIGHRPSINAFHHHVVDLEQFSAQH
ncbi:MAG: ABC transporter ATP-binding protein/permease [Gammaproteobacteria bacterium]|nr:ABC transporter ATP-binding protein/permease [Gammaproteobacteria bacterium]